MQKFKNVQTIFLDKFHCWYATVFCCTIILLICHLSGCIPFLI